MRGRHPRSAAGETESVLDLIYEEAVRSIALQASTIDEFRTRAGTIVQTASIAAGFLGAGQVISHAKFGWPAWIGVSSFGLVGILTTIVLWPRWHWKLNAGPREMLRSFVDIESPMTLATATRHAAEDLADGLVHNNRRLKAISYVLAAACVFLVVEIVSFLVGLGGG